MAAVDRCVGAMLAAELEAAGDDAIFGVHPWAPSVVKTYVPRRVLLDGIPTEDIRAYLEEERADG
jgi:hypothetical protein